MDERSFEHFIEQVLIKLGARDTRVVAKRQDKGADVLATFRVAGTISQTLAVQAKFWGPEPPLGPKVVEDLIRGIEAHHTGLGLIVTTGTIAEEAEKAAPLKTIWLKQELRLSS